MALGFSWFAEKVVKKRKEQGIMLIVFKVEIVGKW
jgi:hypothetical protein